MGNTCQSACATADLEIDVCSILQSEAAIVVSEFAKTPRMEPLFPKVRDAKTPCNLPQLMLRRPGETHREHVAMDNVVTYRSDYSTDSEGTADAASGAEVTVPVCEDPAAIGTLAPQDTTELSQLMLRLPGETHREHIAMANVLALVPDATSCSASRSDCSMDSDDALDDTFEAAAEMGGESSLCQVSASGTVEFDASSEGTRGPGLLEKRCATIPPLKLRRLSEALREQIAMAKVSALPADMTSRSDWSATPIEGNNLRAVGEDHRAGLLLQTWRASMDTDELGLRDFANKCTQQAVSELKKPDNVPRLMLRRPGETHREQVALAKAMVQPDMTARSKCSAASRGISGDTQDEVFVSAANPDHTVLAVMQQACGESQEASEMTCREKPQSHASKFARSGEEVTAALPNLLLSGPGQTFHDCKVAAVQQLKLAMCPVAASSAVRPAQNDLSVVPRGKVKGLAAMWEKKHVLPAGPLRDPDIAKPTVSKDNKFVARFWKDFPEGVVDSYLFPQSSKEKVPFATACGKTVVPHVAGVQHLSIDAETGVCLAASGKKAVVPVAMQGSSPETCATPLRARRSTAQSLREADLGVG